MFGMVVEELNRLWVQQQRIPSLISNPAFRGVWDYILYYANESLLEKPVGSSMRIGNALFTHIPRSISANLVNPTEDGFTQKDDSVYYKTGGTIIYIGGVMAAGIIWRGYVEWDVSSIPSNSIIKDTVFKYECNRHDGDCHIHEMLGRRPSTSTAQPVYDEAGEGNIYADPVGFPVVAANQSVDLGAQADTDLQNQLALGWFAIGIQADTEPTNDINRIYSEDHIAPNPPPTLYLEFELPGPPTPPGSTMTATQAVPSGSRHIETPFIPYSISLTTDRVLRHVTKRVRG